MAIVKWRDPFKMIPRSVWPTFWTDEEVWPEETESLTVYETDNDVVVKASVAGVPAEKVDVSVEGQTLTIKAEHQETEEEKQKKKVVYRQGREARYFYTTSLPSAVQSDKAEAEIKDGVVTVSVPKKEAAKPKKIKVKAAQK